MNIRAHVNCNPKASKATKRALLAAIRHVHKTMGKKHKAITAARIEAHNSASRWKGAPVKECEPPSSEDSSAETGQQSLFSGIGELALLGAGPTHDQRDM